MYRVRKKLRSLFRKEDGAVNVLVVFFLGLFGLAFAALVIDASILYAKRSAMITAADAGALAGANVIREQVVAGKSSTDSAVVNLAKTTARQLALDNGADSTLTTVEVVQRPVTLPNGSTETRQVVDVTVGVVEPSIFARFTGNTENTVRAKSTGTWGYVKKTFIGNILPIFIFDSAYKIDQQTYLHGLIEAPPEETTSSSSTTPTSSGTPSPTPAVTPSPTPGQITTNAYGYIELSGAGKDTIMQALAGTYTGGLFIEEPVLDGAPGKGNFVSNAIEDRMKAAATLGSVGERRSSMLGLIPVINWQKFKAMPENFKNNGQLASHLKLPIEYFAYYEITDVIKSNDYWGSRYALNPFEDANSHYNSVGTGGRRDYSAVVGAKPPSDLIVGRFTGETVQARTLVELGDQLNPNPDGGPLDAAAMYAKLIK